jgi:hypothetical protein
VTACAGEAREQALSGPECPPILFLSLFVHTPLSLSHILALPLALLQGSQRSQGYGSASAPSRDGYGHVGDHDEDEGGSYGAYGAAGGGGRGGGGRGYEEQQQQQGGGGGKGFSGFGGDDDGEWRRGGLGGE